MQTDVERLLARLLTDCELRERFIADPAGVAVQMGLSVQEAASIAGMPAQDIRTAGRSYEHKRNAACKRVRGTWFLRWFASGRT